MNRILIDTNIYSHAMQGRENVISVLQLAPEIGICPVSIAELFFGFKDGNRENENRTELGKFLDSPRVRLHGIDEDTAEHYAEILEQLRRAGTAIPTNDIWIAAVAQQNGLRLFSMDSHFEKIPGLLRITR
jgi:predicted nucleic acid-binding protein